MRCGRSGRPAPAGKAAEDILALETRLAEASLAPAAAADPAATSHRVAFAQLASARFDWDRYFTEAGLPRTRGPRARHSPYPIRRRCRRFP